MNTSPTICKISASILAAQRQIGGAVKDEKNPHFRSDFASLGSVIHAVKFALNEHGISILQPIGRDELGDYVETILLHESGEFMADKIRLVCAKQNDPQAAGSAQSYARRYGLQSFLTLPTVDDDGEAAMYRQEQREARDEQNRAQGSKPSVQAPKQENRSVNKPGEVRVHFGKNRGLRLDELTPQQRHWYHVEWLPKKEVNGPASPEDLVLINALKNYPKDMPVKPAPKQSVSNLETWMGFIQAVHENGHDIIFLLGNKTEPTAYVKTPEMAKLANEFCENNTRVTASVHKKPNGKFDVISIEPLSEPPLN